jgi:hypothetical protein
MKFPGLDSKSVVARVRASSLPTPVPSFTSSIAFGSVGFGMVSVAAFAVWSQWGYWLSAHVGELGLYAACALVLIGGGSAVFSRLIIGPDRLRRFCGLFALGFFLYAGVWTGSFFSLRGKSGEWLGALLGPAILGMTFANAFGAPSAVRKVVVVLVVSHAAGYFAGGFLYHAFPGTTGKLLWGAAYGLGFGGGIGYTLHTCQEPAREALRIILPPDNAGSSHQPPE